MNADFVLQQDKKQAISMQMAEDSAANAAAFDAADPIVQMEKWDGIRPQVLEAGEYCGYQPVAHGRLTANRAGALICAACEVEAERRRR